MPAAPLARRTFLQGTAVAAAAVALGRGGPAIAAKKPTTPTILNNGTYPIGVFFPPTLAETTDARYKQIAECGITFVEGGTGGDDVYNIDANRVLLPVCERQGVMAIVNDERENFFNVPQDQWEPLMQQLLDDYLPYPAFVGFHGGDELPESHYAAIAGQNALLHQMAPTKLNQVNLVGYPFGSPTYPQYLQTYVQETSPSFLSFDRYMLLDPTQNTPADQALVESQYFTTGAYTRLESLAAGNLPTWMYAQSVIHTAGNLHYRAPSVADLLWQVNTAMAYGCTGIQYFTYWTPPPYVAAMIDKNGNPTQIYYNAQEVNTKHLQPVGRQMLGLVSESVGHFGESSLPPGVVAFAPNNWVGAAAGDPAIISMFSNPGKRAERRLFVANRSYSGAATTILTLTSSVLAVEVFDPALRRFRPMRIPGNTITVRLDAGAAALYRLIVKP